MINPVPSIIYKSPRSGDERKIIVVDGIPFYQSTGKNSGARDTWFPFVTLRGNKEPTIPEDLTEISSTYLSYIFDNSPENYIIKYDTTWVKTDLPQVMFDGRIPTKKTLIISSRLNPSPDEEALTAAGLTPSEIALAQDKITLAAESEIVNDPDAVNEWLITQNAEIVSKIFGKKINTQAKSGNKTQEYVDAFIADINGDLNAKQYQFLLQLFELNEKVNDLHTRGQINAFEQASALHTTLSDNLKNLVNGTMDNDTFRTSSSNAIKLARTELEHFRGLKLILANLAIALVTLGVGYIAAGLANLFFTDHFVLLRPQSARKLDELDSELSQIAPGA
ncbi:hypothetical protein [Legionella hackeliae]|uniref:Uncharacterized protein n=1 Tax=Legionella hackeliae TaxID=449 RepID=A0A0A8ULX0_LEGHA|nr:hypothetical protein [Legionella hackeliae]KTD10371.1 hypothetical protein Lhac_2739 [Legionella hackeliae]CEK09870.1 protein of unknown function [Legionella hackeliae]STX49780.1 Uncharacterised protein [Legionella hackeliae]